MKKQFDERNLTMVMDFYELTMANGYFKDEDKERKVAFDVFYRKNPDNAGYAIFAGLEQIIEYIENLHFDEDDIEMLEDMVMIAVNDAMKQVDREIEDKMGKYTQGMPGLF